MIEQTETLLQLLRDTINGHPVFTGEDVKAFARKVGVIIEPRGVWYIKATVSIDLASQDEGLAAQVKQPKTGLKQQLLNAVRDEVIGSYPTFENSEALLRVRGRINKIVDDINKE